MGDGLKFAARATLLFVLACATALVWGCAGPASVREREGVVRGTVTYLQEIPLPPDADLVVQLRQLSGPGEPLRLVAERRIEAPGQLPVSFELRYERRAVDASRRYELAALVLRGERTVLMSGSAYPVLTGRYPDPVRVVLQPSR